MANNFSPVGNEIQVNLAPNQDLFQVQPDIASLADGRFLVVFTDPDLIQGNVIGQFVNGDGTLSGVNFDVDVDVDTFEFEPAVAQRAGGGAVVVWTDADPGAGIAEIHYAAVSSGGAVGPEQTIFSGPLDSFLPDVATLADGRSLVVAQQGFGVEDMVFRFIDPAGSPVGVQDFIDAGPNRQIAAAVAASGNTALVVYLEEVGVGDSDLQARFYDGSGFAAEMVIDDTGALRPPDVAALVDGGFVVVYHDFDGSSLLGRFVSATGALGAAFDIPDLGGINNAPRVAALPDGGFIVTWDSNAVPPPEDDSGAILARRFDSTGTPVGDVFLVNQGSDDAQFSPAVAANATGQTFIAWEDTEAFTGVGEDGDPFGIRGHAFTPTTDIVNGSALGDVIRTYDLGEPINGFGGDDLINALGGDDFVRGGGGSDHIKGGLGNDRLFGEGGEDLLKGEQGDDLLVGGLGRDVLLGGAGRDTFDFNAIAQSRSGANHDLIKGFQHFEDDRIDLETIDADTTTDGNQAFDFIGEAGFSGTAGELRLAGGLLQGDINGNGIADFEVKVTGIGAGANSDFVL